MIIILVNFNEYNNMSTSSSPKSSSSQSSSLENETRIQNLHKKHGYAFAVAAISFVGLIAGSALLGCDYTHDAGVGLLIVSVIGFIIGFVAIYYYEHRIEEEFYSLTSAESNRKKSIDHRVKEHQESRRTQ